MLGETCAWKLAFFKCVHVLSAGTLKFLKSSKGDPLTQQAVEVCVCTCMCV